MQRKNDEDLTGGGKNRFEIVTIGGGLGVELERWELSLS